MDIHLKYVRTPSRTYAAYTYCIADYVQLHLRCELALCAQMGVAVYVQCSRISHTSCEALQDRALHGMHARDVLFECCMCSLIVHYLYAPAALPHTTKALRNNAREYAKLTIAQSCIEPLGHCLYCDAPYIYDLLD